MRIGKVLCIAKFLKNPQAAMARERLAYIESIVKLSGIIHRIKAIK